jgi:iron-sulfur cluster repair protein YtfE (RIC family)
MITRHGASTEQHARLIAGVDRLAAMADRIDGAAQAGLGGQLDEACAFLEGRLLPHLEAAERVLYPELERLMQNRHSMTPMRREHGTIRALIADLDTHRRRLGGRGPSTGDAVALRRALFKLHALLRIHLAEEQLYADLVEHTLTPEAEANLAAAMRHEGIAAS